MRVFKVSFYPPPYVFYTTLAVEYDYLNCEYVDNLRAVDINIMPLWLCICQI